MNQITDKPTDAKLLYCRKTAILKQFGSPVNSSVSPFNLQGQSSPLFYKTKERKRTSELSKLEQELLLSKTLKFCTFRRIEFPITSEN